MEQRAALLALITVVSGCKSIDCGEGTTERDGTCVPANETVASAGCGPFTELQGNVCVPMFPPTMCDPATTAPDTDEMGVTTCVATGVSGCAVKLACPTPAAGLQTVCGQLYDFETNVPFAAAGASGSKCAAGVTSGPCSLAIKAYDAAAFATGTPQPLTTGQVYIDDCGRYRLPDVPVSQVVSQILAIGIDDARADSAGPLGTTNVVGLTTAATSGALKDFDAFVIPATTTAKWASSGGPVLSTTQGILAAVYHGHSIGSDLVAGVTFKSFHGSAQTSVYYLGGAMRSTVDAGLGATAANGTALVTITNGMQSDLYFGLGGIDTACMWKPQPALTVPGIVLIEGFRPTAVSGMTCSL